MLLEPRWKTYMAITTEPIFTPKQCQLIINAGHAQKPEQARVGGGKKDGIHDTKKRLTTISWIPFKTMPERYQQI